MEHSGGLFLHPSYDTTKTTFTRYHEETVILFYVLLDTGDNGRLSGLEEIVSFL